MLLACNMAQARFETAQWGRCVEMAHWGSCLFMTGVIWIIQLVHYPAFAFVQRRQFSEFVRFHTDTITGVVLPPMLAELSTAVLMWWQARRTATGIWHTCNVASVALIWAFTFLLSVPCHDRLAKGWHAPTHRRLVRTNWLRTIAWSVRACVILQSHVGAGRYHAHSGWMDKKK